MASCDDITPVEMRGKSSALRNREQFPARKSSLFKTGLRKTSSVSFDEDVPITYSRRWTDSLKIKRKKKKPENVVDKDTENENEDDRDRADDRDSEQNVMRDNTDDICELFEKINK
eukprot:GFUD01093502.1.p1 GENE.GFUD01093502.1~~GFUD01093502.1.p1  ORF type:complete len:116 (+),score=50.77 GFUD01093502.1:74-421(+)